MKFLEQPYCNFTCGLCGIGFENFRALTDHRIDTHSTEYAPLKDVGQMIRDENTRIASETPKGIKFDQNKPPLAFIPSEAIFEEAKAFGHGEKKYGAYNFTNGLAVSRTISGALRHIFQFLSGEDTDSESGAHHLGCARANLAMALDTLKRHPELDDRPKGSK